MDKRIIASICLLVFDFLWIGLYMGNQYKKQVKTIQGGKMKVNIISEDGEVITKEWENLLQLAKLKCFDVEKEYTLNGSKVKLKGYNSRARKWCYIVEYVKDGRVVRVGDQWFDKAVMDSSCKSGSCGC